MTKSKPDNNDFPDLPWTIEQDLLDQVELASTEKIIDLVIARYLMAGDPRPFCWWVEQGHRPSDAVLKVLAHTLNPDATKDERFPYYFERKQRFPKKGREQKGPEQKLRDILIALCIQKRLQDNGPGSYDATIKDIANWVGVSEALTKQAYDTYKDAVANPTND